MAPYREKKQGTTSSGFRHPDPLEVTRTTSNNSMSSVPDSPTSSRLSTAATVLECDYDTNPTVLYQAIEAKQWDYAISLFTNRGNCRIEDGEDYEEEASATWVVRKECNGKLRWRLLPLHAAIIFGSPLKLIELLLADYPLAAQCKDDRGMLPLHLAFRKQACWDVIDELLTTYPLAVFVSDRKGRTPLMCGISKSSPQQQHNINNANTIQSVGSTISMNNGESPDTSAFRTAAGVLQLYSQIVISGERKRVEQETRTLAQTSISQIQDAHCRQLESIQKKIEIDKDEAKHRIEHLEGENKELQERLRALEEELADRNQPHVGMTTKMRPTNVKINVVNESTESVPSSPIRAQPHQNATKNQSIDKVLRMMAETMVRQQKAYHQRVQSLLTNYEGLISEREKIRSIFLKDSTEHQQKEAFVLESFRDWFQEEGKRLSMQERSLLSPQQPSSIDCDTTFEMNTVDGKALESITYELMGPDRAIKEVTKASTTTVPTVQEKMHSATSIAATTTISRIPLSETNKQQRPMQKEPREAPA